MTDRLRPACLAIALLALAACATTAGAPPPLELAFDRQTDQVTIAGEVSGRRLRFLLDSAVDPSVVDRRAAADLGLPRQSGDDAIDGVGSDAATAYESTLTGLSLGGRSFGPIPVVVADLARIEQRLGAPLQGVLGYSFLKDHPVVIDYVADRVTVFAAGQNTDRAVRGCRKAWRLPLAFVSEEDKIILVPGLSIGGHPVPAMLDTGSSNGLRIEADADELAAVRPLLPEGEAGTSVGARGEAPVRRGVLAVPAALGPFEVSGAAVTLAGRRPGATPVNIGNQFLRAMQVRLLIDMPGRSLGFFGDCRG